MPVRRHQTLPHLNMAHDLGDRVFDLLTRQDVPGATERSLREAAYQLLAVNRLAE